MVAQIGRAGIDRLAKGDAEIERPIRVACRHIFKFRGQSRRGRGRWPSPCWWVGVAVAVAVSVGVGVGVSVGSEICWTDTGGSIDSFRSLGAPPS